MRARELLTRLDTEDLRAVTSSELAARIADLVRDRRLPAGVDLPSERDLAAALGRSRGTVARAYEQLRDGGLAYTRHGAGTTIGCCPGPWASSRAAELAPIVAPAIGAAADGPTIDLRTVRFERHRCPAGGHGNRGEPAVAHAVAGHLAAHGLPAAADELLLTGGRSRALDVALAALLRPNDRVLVPALADPELLALLRVRGLHPVALPLEGDGRIDLPGWLRRLRSGAATVAVVSPTYGPPAGAVLAAHERRLLVEAAAETGVTLVDDLSHADLWLDRPPPTPLAGVHRPCGAVVSLASTAAATGTDAALGWLHVDDAALRERFAAVASALDAAPSDALVAAAHDHLDDHAEVLRERREQLADHAAAVIQLVTPAAPRLRVAAYDGGPTMWLRLADAPTDAVAAAARDGGVLLRNASDLAVAGGADGVVLPLTAPRDDLLRGVQLIVEVTQRPASGDRTVTVGR